MLVKLNSRRDAFFDEKYIYSSNKSTTTLRPEQNKTRKFGKEGDALAEQLSKKEDIRRFARKLLKAKLLSKLRISVPFSPKIPFKPDLETTSLTRLRKGKIGLAKIKVAKMLYPKPKIVSIKDLGRIDVEDNFVFPTIRYSYIIYADGSYHGLKGTQSIGRRGHYMTYTRNRSLSTRIAIVPTILSAIASSGSPKRIGANDIAYKLMVGRRRLLLVVAVDSSESMQPYIPILLRTLIMLHKIAWKTRNLIGLIEIRSPKSRVLVYPTTNINNLIAGIYKLKFGGRTPLAEGLLRAYRLIVSMKIKYPDIISRILLFSDGIANIELEKPLYNYYRERLVSPAQADVLSVGKLLATRKIRAIVVNPWHMEHWPGKALISPTRLLMALAQFTGGVYLGFDLEHYQIHDRYTGKPKPFDSNFVESISREIVEAILESLVTISK